MLTGVVGHYERSALDVLDDVLSKVNSEVGSSLLKRGACATGLADEAQVVVA